MLPSAGFFVRLSDVRRGVAQLGLERLPWAQEVAGSNPVAPTNTLAMYFVYILQSLSSGRFYVGQCDHLIERFGEHERGANRATRGRGPWSMPYYEVYPTRMDALRRKREIKSKKSAISIRRIIATGCLGTMDQLGLERPERASASGRSLVQIQSPRPVRWCHPER